MAITTLKDTGSQEDNHYLKDKKFETEGATTNDFTEKPPPDLYTDAKGNAIVPRGNVASVPGKVIQMQTKPTFFIPESMESMWDEGFTGDNFEDLYKHRSEEQPGITKFLYTVGGGAISGVGSLIQSVGNLIDYKTYVGMFTDIDQYSAKSYNMFRLPSKFLVDIGKGIKESTNEDIMPVYEDVGTSYLEQSFNWGAFKSVIDSATSFALLGFGIGKVVELAGNGILKGLSSLGKAVATSEELAMGETALKSLSMVERNALRASRIEAYGKLMEQRFPQLSKALTKENMNDFVTSIFTKAAEAKMEGLDAYQSYIAKNQDLVANGLVTQQQLDEIASKNAEDVTDATYKLFALDFMQIKSVLRGSKIMSKELKNPNWWTRTKPLLLGAPKEGTEETIQQVAQMEGDYQTLQDVAKMKPGNLTKMQELGKDPNEYPERYMERLQEFLVSNEVLAAATIGAISGPAQSGALSLFGRKQRIKNLNEAYQTQQQRYADNKKMFSTSVEFQEKARQIELSEDARKIAKQLGDEEAESISEDVLFTQIALDNFHKGSADQLRRTLQESKEPKAKQLLSKLDELEKDYLSSKKYVNSAQVFNLRNAIKINQRIVDNALAKSKDPTVDEKTRKSYEVAAKESQEAINEQKTNLDNITSKDHQMKLAVQAVAKDKLDKAEAEIETTKSITKLNKIAEEFPSLKKDVTERINLLRGIGTVTKTETTKESGPKKLVEEKETTPNKNSVEGQVKTVARKVKKQVPLTPEENKILVENEESIKEQIIEDSNTETDTEGNVVNQGTSVLSFDEFKSPKQPYRAAANAVLNTVISQNKGKLKKITFNQVKNYLYSIYLKNPSISPQELAVYAMDYLEQIDSLTKDPKTTVPSSASPVKQSGRKYGEETETKIKKVFENLVKTDPLMNKGKETSEEGEEFALAPEDREKALREEQEDNATISSFLAAREALIQEGVDVNNFKELMQAFQDVIGDPVIVKRYYQRLVYLHAFKTNELVTDDYNTLFNITEGDLDNEGFTPQKARFIFDTILETVHREAIDSETIYKIYMDEEVVVAGEKNRNPAASIAFLSRAYEFKYVSDKVVEKTNSNLDEVHGNPILNPNRFNQGHEIVIESAYDTYGEEGGIRMETGNTVSWKRIKEAWGKLTHQFDKEGRAIPENEERWLEFLQQNQLSDKFDIYDFIPLTVKDKETGELIGFVHNTQWINKVSSATSVIEENTERLRAFRRRVIPALHSMDKGKFETRISKKVIEYHDGKYSGFVLNSRATAVGSDTVFKDNITFGVMSISELEVPENQRVKDNIINMDQVDQYHSGTAFAFIPLGEVDGEMKYHATPLVSRKLKDHPEIARTLRQLVEIFIKQDKNINLELYNAYAQQGLDLLSKDGFKHLTTILDKIVMLYNPDKMGPMSETIKGRQGKESLGFLQTEGGTVIFGKSTVHKLRVGKSRTKKEMADIDKALNMLETAVLPHMYFNTSKDYINSDETFKFSSVDENNKITTFEGSYNDFLKQHTTTFMRSTELEDGGVSYTAQNITVFDMDTKNLDSKVEGLEEEIEETTDVVDQKVKPVIKQKPVIKKEPETIVSQTVENSPLLDSFKDKTGLEVQVINGVQAAVATEGIKKKMKRGYSVFYTAGEREGKPILIARFGKPVSLPGYPNIPVFIEQDRNRIYDLSSGLELSAMNVGYDFKNQAKVIKDVAALINEKIGDEPKLLEFLKSVTISPLYQKVFGKANTEIVPEGLETKEEYQGLKDLIQNPQLIAISKQIGESIEKVATDALKTGLENYISAMEAAENAEENDENKCDW